MNKALITLMAGYDGITAPQQQLSRVVHLLCWDVTSPRETAYPWVGSVWETKNATHTPTK